MSDCFLMGHGGYALPKLDPNYPKDVTLTNYNAEAAFQVVIAKNGRPKKYTYKWYFSEDEGVTFKEVSSGQDKDTLLISGYNGDQEYQVYCEITNKKGTVKSRVAKMTVSVAQPLFTYMVNGVDQANNTAYVVKDGWNTDNWKLSFLQSGDLTFINRGTAKTGLDIFLVGGGGGGGGGVLEGEYSYGGGGGGGGYTTTAKKVSIAAKTYEIIIGAGGKGKGEGTSGDNGTSSSFVGNGISYSALGGYGGYGGNCHVNSTSGGEGGSGGGAGGRGDASNYPELKNYNEKGGNGGSNGQGGSESGDGRYSGGKGSSVLNTCEFEEGQGNPYSGGGAGGMGMGAWWEGGWSGVLSDYILSDGGEYGGGDSDSNATWYGGGGGGGGWEGQGYGSGIYHAGGNGYQGIVIIRNAR